MELTELSGREKMFVLLHQVKSSGLFNMYTESGQAVTHAQCYGVFTGLLKFPDDYADGRMLDLCRIYKDYLCMPYDESQQYNRILLVSETELRRAVFAMRTIGKEIFWRTIQKSGRSFAESYRHEEIKLIPLIFNDNNKGLVLDDETALDISMGIAMYDRFMKVEEDKTMMEEALAREFYFR